MKRLGIVLGLLLVTGIASAQYFGVRGGLNWASEQRGDDIENTEFILANHLGVFMQYPVTSNFYVRPELLYTGKGYASSSTLLGTAVEQYGRINYLEFPFFLGIRSNAGPLNLYFQGGPFVSTALGGRYDENAGPIESEGPLRFGEEDSDDYSSTDYGLAFGVGLDIATTFEVGLSYDLGLKNVRPREQDGEALRTRTIGLTAGVKF